MKLSGGEKLILAMLCELYEHLKVNGEVDHKLVQSAITSGHLWGLEWAYSGSFLVDNHPPQDRVNEVSNILEMWMRLETDYEHLSATDKAKVVDENCGTPPKFFGFDGNDPDGHMGIAYFIVDDLGRHAHFKGRDLNAHSQWLDAYRKMYAVYEPMRPSLIQPMNMAQIIQVLNAPRQ